MDDASTSPFPSGRQPFLFLPLAANLPSVSGRYTLMIDSGGVSSPKVTVTIPENAAAGAVLKNWEGDYEAPDLSGTLTAPVEVKSGADLTLLYRFTNRSRLPMQLLSASLPVPSSGRGYQISVRDSHGRLAPLTEEGKLQWRKMGEDAAPEHYPVQASASSAMLKPGETLKGSLLLNRLYDLREPGTYSVRLAQGNGFRILGAATTVVTVTK